ncbi:MULTISPECIES: hypothetical protein [unclassified Bradyrhizobium]|uniref:hypothetical protein n=1 Tax=unclassified Bradyrhizobium TaxID=2631580 RepID=UPI002479D1B0|nr:MULTISPECIES: hypothetical protein [unclassified Bradyrhizobium]WGR71608.1 hypothetical protein MTX24_01155 [Bradyrhizobium sp. ISRA426]WGR76443.1 hypothetical protein MTX21_26105 [Bradyrhizobium sp. ISRA430]WGR86848.1 hypothetical protein MTX25_01155 [Bradyrhizobium sp. ISRA432]
MRLRTSFRYSLYAAFAALFLTGAGWLAADWQKDVAGDDIWQQIAANMLMVHGGIAMLALLLLGALVPVHLRRSWRGGKNLVSGSVMAAFNAVLIATAFGLYYLGSEAVRPWMSWIHLGTGFSLALMLPLHIWLGRRESR